MCKETAIADWAEDCGPQIRSVYFGEDAKNLPLPGFEA
jgi:hypothetical protein